MTAHVPFAWRNLTHRKVRALVALSGVCFSVLLMFMQAGFYAAVLSAASAVYRNMQGEIFLVSPLYVFLGRTASIPRERVVQAGGISGVRAAVSFYADTQLWRNPVTRLRHPMLVMGFDPASDLLGLPQGSVLPMRDGNILIDSLTRPQFGPQDTGTVSEIGDQQVRIAGQYRIGPGFQTDGAAVMDGDTFIRLFKNRSIQRPSLGVLQVDNGGDVSHIAATLRKALPSDTRVLTRDEMIQAEEDYWATQTSIGPVFAAGAGLGLVIGMVILYQVMATDITNRLREFATLKALGYGTGRLRWIVFQEVSAFSVAGFAVGWLLSAGLHKFVRDATGLPMSMPASRSAGIFVLTLLMCWTSGLLAMRKLRQADPADLY